MSSTIENPACNVHFTLFAVAVVIAVVGVVVHNLNRHCTLETNWMNDEGILSSCYYLYVRFAERRIFNFKLRNSVEKRNE